MPGSRSVTMDELIEHLRIAAGLEKEIFELDKAEYVISSNAKALARKKYPEYIPTEFTPSKPSGWPGITGALFGGIAGGVFEYTAEHSQVESLSDQIAFFFAMCICIAIGAAVFGGLFHLIECIHTKSKNNSRAAFVEKFNAEQKQEHDNEVAISRGKDFAVVEIMDETRKDITTLRSSLKRALEEHYSKGPIYQKYRTFPCVCQLLEYFEARRFQTLGEAYNQYELEVRLDRIIFKLDNILEKLDAIANNQQVLYNELRATKQSIDNLNTKMVQCTNTVDKIRAYSELSAYCAIKTAESVDSIAKIKLYDRRYNLPPCTLANDPIIEEMKRRYIKG